jgi:predicted peroxiredoxin
VTEQGSEPPPTSLGPIDRRAFELAMRYAAMAARQRALAEPESADDAEREEREAMSDANGRVVINLTAGHEDVDRVTVAFLVGTAALSAGKRVVAFLTKEAVRLGLPGYGEAIESAGAPPVARLMEQFAEGGGELFVCPICFNARKLDEHELIPNARLAGATPLWEWVGSGSATVFSY